MLEFKEGHLLGLTDEFIVKLKAEGYFDQLKNLVEQHACKIVKENDFVKNQFLLSVPKTSGYNSLQLANLFYETGLFEFSEPNFYHLNIFNSNDTFLVVNGD